MNYAPLTLLFSVALLAACPPAGQDSGTTSEPGSSTGPSGSTTSEDTPTSTGSTGPTSAGSSTTGDGTGTTENATTEVDPGTTQPVDTTGSDTTGSDTSSDTTGLDTTGSGTTGEDTTGTTADDSTSTGDPDDTQGIPETTGGGLCEGMPGQVDVEWSLELPPALADKPLTAGCKIVDSQEMGPKVTVNFSCTVQNVKHPVVLHYALSPGQELLWGKGDAVEMVYRREPGLWTNEWLSIVGGYTNFRGARADRLKPPGIGIEDFYGRPVSIGTPCDPQPDPCGQRQGLELRVATYADGMPTYVPVHAGDHFNFGFPVGELVWLEQADRLLEPIGCDDVAPVWIDFVFIEDFSKF